LTDSACRASGHPGGGGPAAGPGPPRPARRRRPRWRDLGDLADAVGGGSLGPDPVHRAAVGDRHHPGGRAAPGGVEPLGGPPDLQHDFLGYFLGLGGIAEHLADDPVDRPGELIVNGRERDVIAAGDPGQEPRQASFAPLPMARTRLMLATLPSAIPCPLFETVPEPDWSRTHEGGFPLATSRKQAGPIRGRADAMRCVGKCAFAPAAAAAASPQPRQLGRPPNLRRAGHGPGGNDSGRVNHTVLPSWPFSRLVVPHDQARQSTSHRP